MGEGSGVRVTTHLLAHLHYDKAVYNDLGCFVILPCLKESQVLQIRIDTSAAEGNFGKYLEK